ncbi:hypothetical protein ES703_97623 [subsurface metagenome]
MYVVAVDGFNLLLELVMCKDGAFFLIEFDPSLVPGRDDLHVIFHLGEGFLVINEHFGGFVREIVPQGAQANILFLVDK